MKRKAFLRTLALAGALWLGAIPLGNPSSRIVRKHRRLDCAALHNVRVWDS